MDFTFKKKSNHHSLPFLERFKHKISKVDKINGLIGALGLELKEKRSNEDIKRRVRTQGNANKGNLRLLLSKNVFERSCQTRFHSVEINHFNPLGDDQKDKENLDTNLPMGGRAENKDVLLVKTVLTENDKELQRKGEELRELILPKISRGSVSVPEGSRIRQKMRKKYDRFRVMNLQKRAKGEGVSLRQ